MGLLSERWRAGVTCRSWIGGSLIGLVSAGDLTAWLVRELREEVSDLTAYIHGPCTASAG